MIARWEAMALAVICVLLVCLFAASLLWTGQCMLGGTDWCNWNDPRSTP